ncbi:hypothetical protein F2Q69_00022330 [Brassica cretica]|uniref:Uncharacterized protein n=1 Tax=Brassica cretica TaxID=69181 RepID=A0A8S9QAZ2_BRACR|nr:hypothetical protein F2Q69_00022330 [Brassica cretica]
MTTSELTSYLYSRDLFLSFGRSEVARNSEDHESRLRVLQLKALLILAQTISACSTPVRKQDDLRHLADSSRPDQHVGQLAFPISEIRQLATTSARVPISSSSRFISLVVHSTLLEVKVI